MSYNASVRTVRTDFFEMEYVTFGAGSHPLVILPGLGIKSVAASAEGIAAAYAMFAEDYTVYLFERITDIPAGYTVEAMAADTAAAMDALGLSGADVFGVSLGGMIAQALALARPDLVARLVLGSTAARAVPSAAETVGEWTKLARAGDVDALTDRFAGLLYSESFCEQFGGALRAMHRDVTEEELARFSRLAQAGAGFDIYDRLGEIRMPALVLGAENDRIVTGAASVELAEALGAELYLYGGDYGHGVYDEAPDYKDRIWQFLHK